jgi:hypothetical protein
MVYSFFGAAFRGAVFLAVRAAAFFGVWVFFAIGGKSKALFPA